MKKNLSVLVSLGMILSLSACTLIPQADIDPGMQPQVAPISLNDKPTDTPEPIDKPSDTDVTEPTDNPEENPVLLEHVNYEIGSEWLSAWKTENGNYIGQMTNTGYEYIMIPDGYPKLKEFFSDKRNNDKKQYEENEVLYEEDWEENLSEYMMTINDVKSYIVTRADNQVFSVTEKYFQGYGETAGNDYVTVNVDSQTGKEMSIGDFVYLTDDLYEYLTDFLFENYDSNDFLNEEYEDNKKSIEEYLTGEEGSRMISVYPNKVEFIFNQYYLTFGYAEAINIPIFFDEHPEFFVENLFVPANDSYIVRYSPEFKWFEDFDGDGQREAANIWCGIDYEEFYGEFVFETLQLESGDFSSSADTWSVETPEFYVAKRGKDFYVLLQTNPRLIHCLEIYKLDGKDMCLTPTGSYQGEIQTIDNFDRILFAPMEGIFATFFSMGEFGIDEKGELERKEEFMEIVEMDEHPLVTIADIYGKAVDDNLNVSDKKVDIPAGSVLDFRYSNGYNGVIVENEDGDLIYLERDSNNKICGMEEYEAFETLYYYG